METTPANEKGTVSGNDLYTVEVKRRSRLGFKLIGMLVLVLAAKTIMFATPYYDSGGFFWLSSLQRSLSSGVGKGWVAAPVMLVPLLLVWLADFFSGYKGYKANGIYLGAYLLLGFLLLTGAVVGHLVIDPFGRMKVFVWTIVATLSTSLVFILWAALFSRTYIAKEESEK